MNDPAGQPVLLDGARTPIGRYLGGLSSLSGPQLGAAAVREAVRRSGVDAGAVDEVILGNAVSAGSGQAPARQAAILGGVGESVPAVTINMVCGSGLRAVMLASQAIRAKDASVVVAGGFESMSRTPHYLEGMRSGVRFGDRTARDGVIHDGLWCSFHHCHMGGHAEYTAHKAGVAREDADAFALASHRKAVAAMREGKFAREIVPVDAPERGGQRRVEADESPRPETTPEALARLRPVFGPDAPKEVRDPVVTAGNAPGLNDGAAALVVASKAFADAHGLPYRASVTGYSMAATAPRDLFFAPIESVRRLMRSEGTEIGDYELVELNEAFAVQAIADMRALEIEEGRVNVHGGAVALGHPIGASGARILLTLLGAMEDRDAEKGLAALCLGGGSAVSLSVER